MLCHGVYILLKKFSIFHDMKAKYIYRIVYSLIIAHMVHKMYCRATARYHVPLIAVLLGFLGIDLAVKPVKYDEDGDVIEGEGERPTIAKMGKIPYRKLQAAPTIGILSCVNNGSR